MHLMREMVTQTKQVIFEHISLTQQESTKKSDPLLGFFNIYIYNNTHLFIHSDDSVGIIQAIVWFLSRVHNHIDTYNMSGQ